MKISRRSLLMSPALLSGLALPALAGESVPGRPEARASVRTIDLWPSPFVPPSSHPSVVEEIEETSADPAVANRRMKGIARPRLAVFSSAKPNGASVLIIPGGGFGWNYFDHEGYRVADFLTANGITCFVLFYRLANDGWSNPADVGLADTQRAMRMIRHMSHGMNLDPQRVGTVGFSAGGFLSASIATRHAAQTYPHADAVDDLDARPAVSAAIYPVISLTEGVAYSGLAPSLFGGKATQAIADTYLPTRNVSATTAPMFLAHAEDDGLVPVGNTLEMRQALANHRIPVETHLFAHGGHGWGMRPDLDQPYHVWPQLFFNFLRSQGLGS